MAENNIQLQKTYIYKYKNEFAAYIPFVCNDENAVLYNVSVANDYFGLPQRFITYTYMYGDNEYEVGLLNRDESKLREMIETVKEKIKERFCLFFEGEEIEFFDGTS